MRKNSIVRVSAKERFGDNNNGFKFGVEYYDDSEDIFPVEIEWFKTNKEREAAIKAAREAAAA